MTVGVLLIGIVVAFVAVFFVLNSTNLGILLAVVAGMAVGGIVTAVAVSIILLRSQEEEKDSTSGNQVENH